jgi:hypothetical protein
MTAPAPLWNGKRDARDWVRRWVDQADDRCNEYGSDPMVGGWFHLLAFAGSCLYLLAAELLTIAYNGVRPRRYHTPEENRCPTP